MASWPNNGRKEKEALYKKQMILPLKYVENQKNKPESNSSQYKK